MKCRAYLTQVRDRVRTAQRLRDWVNATEIEGILDDVQNGVARLITTFNCDQCKAHLEEHGAALVHIEYDM